MAWGQVSVLTQHNDNARTGLNPNEIILTTSNVNVSQFGKLFARTVDGQIYAQPLYVPSLSLGGKTRNVVYVATENNSVYAFDADDPSASTALWHVNLGTPVPSADICSPSSAGCPYVDLVPQIGITSTPVIDAAAGALYVLAKNKDNTNTYHFRLHALDLLSGAEKFGGPVEIAATNFKPLSQNNRPGLLLVNGVVYAAFGSVGDITSWHGWIFGFNSSTLQQLVAFNATPGGSYGGIWGGGIGLAADADSIYAISGNGTFDVNTGGSDYGDSVLRLSTSSGLKVADYFTPDNQSNLFNADADLGSGGPLLLPGTSLLVMAGKDGILRLIDTTNMGKFNPTFNADVQELKVSPGQVLGGFAYANSPTFGPAVYLWAPGDFLKAWKFNGSTFQTTPASQGTIKNVTGESPLAPLSISSNQNQTGTGIVWGIKPASDPNHTTVTGTLYAFDANDLTRELWDTSQNAARDALGNYAKFSTPTVANGKVYVGTFSGQLLAYGLNPPAVTSVAFVQVNAATPQTATASVAVPYKSPQSAGDLNVVVVGWNDTTSSVQSVTDSAGNAYALAVGPTRGTAISQSIYYAKNIKGGSNTVTVTFNQAAIAADVRVLEYAGADTSNPLDVTAIGTGKSTTASTSSVSTNAANELLVGADTVYTGNAGPGPGFSARIITSPDSDLAEDRVVNVTGSYNASAPLSSSGNWVMQMAAFRQKGAIANPAPTVSSISPVSGPTGGGTAVTISGSNFASGASVSLGGAAAGNVAFVNSSTLTATTPAHAAGAVNVVVTNTDAQSGTLTNGFTYQSPNPAPTVSSISPVSGPTGGGTAVTISGSNFVSGASVSLGGTAASNVVFVNSSTLTATTPAHAAGAVNVVVTNPDAQSGTLTNGFTYQSVSGSISFAQVAAATPQSSTASVNVAYPAAQTAGDLNVVVVGWNDATSSVASVIDSAGNAYSLAIGPTTGVNLRQSIYYAPNIKGGANTVTVTFNQAAAFPDVRVLEYKGLNPASPLDAAHGASGASATASSGAVTTTSASELVFGANTVYTGNKTPGSGFTVRIITSPDSDLAEDQTVSATGNYSATSTLTSSGNWVMQVVTFKQ
ncbi:MAG TPA: IPT/TIG domain-containing protein [Terriglobales bacterium]|nr:IPT/TIG domain-containing protein [Terriglobales bacterium]